MNSLNKHFSTLLNKIDDDDDYDDNNNNNKIQ